MTATPKRGYQFAVARDSHVAGMYPVRTVVEPQRHDDRASADKHVAAIDWRLQPAVIEVPKT